MSFIVIVLTFWLFVFSVLTYKLSHGTQEQQERHGILVIPLIVLAWTSVIGSPIYDLVKEWLLN